MGLAIILFLVKSDEITKCCSACVDAILLYSRYARFLMYFFFFVLVVVVVLNASCGSCYLLMKTIFLRAFVTI